MEHWVNITGFEGYQVSNLGRIKSLKQKDSRILALDLDNKGYLRVSLYIQGKKKNLKVHVIVASAFLAHSACGHTIVINHKDFNKQNNAVLNLELVSQRVNSDKKHISSSSKYTGVYWYTPRNCWRANIWFDGRCKHLGYFKEEIKANEAYQNALKQINI